MAYKKPEYVKTEEDISFEAPGALLIILVAVIIVALD